MAEFKRFMIINKFLYLFLTQIFSSENGMEYFTFSTPSCSKSISNKNTTGFTKPETKDPPFSIRDELLSIPEEPYQQSNSIPGAR